MRGLILACCMATPLAAEGLVPTRLIRPNEIILEGDITVSSDVPDRGAGTPEALIGLEARVLLYPGRPIGPADFGRPALVDRNQIVSLHYWAGGLAIQTEGRALARGAEGDLIKVMNLASKSTLSGRVRADGSVDVTE